MYYAACCCDSGPPPPCTCGGLSYAKISARYSRFSNFLTSGQSCDVPCERNKLGSLLSTSTNYFDIEINLGCTSTSGGVTYSTNTPLLNNRFKVNPDRFSIGYRFQYRVFATETRVALMSQCDPPHNQCNNVPGQYHSILDEEKNIDLFDPLQNIIIGRADPTVSTTVMPGGLVELPPEVADTVAIENQMWYRFTSFSFSTVVDTINTRYKKEMDGTVTNEIENDSDAISFSIKNLRLIGDVCEPHSQGSELVTYAGTYANPRILSYSNTETENTTTDCPERREPVACSGPVWDYHVVPAHQVTGQSSRSENIEGVVFGLEFTDESPPFLP